MGKRIIRLTEADIKNIIYRLTNKDYSDDVEDMIHPKKQGFPDFDERFLQNYIEAYGPIKVIGKKYACQKRYGEWVCYDKTDRKVPHEEIMSEFDLSKFGFSFEDFIESYGN